MNRLQKHAVILLSVVLSGSAFFALHAADVKNDEVQHIQQAIRKGRFDAAVRLLNEYPDLINQEEVLRLAKEKKMKRLVNSIMYARLQHAMMEGNLQKVKKLPNKGRI